MRILIALLGLCLGLTAQAADRKIGNVIIVERTLSNVYDNCLANVRSDTGKPSQFYMCVVGVTTQPYETMLNKGWIRHKTDRCNVESEFVSGKIMITFGDSTTGTFADGKVCLAGAVGELSLTKALIQTLETP